MPGFKIVADEYIPGWRRGPTCASQWRRRVPRSSSTSARWRRSRQVRPSVGLGDPARGVAAPGFGEFKAFTVAEIEDIIDMFAGQLSGRRRGIDGTEFNAACNHFVNNFLSRAWNRREDEYGAQTFENRTRVAVDHQRDQAAQRRRLAPDHADERHRGLSQGRHNDRGEEGVRQRSSSRPGRRPRGARRVLHVDQGRGPSREPALPGHVPLPAPHRSDRPVRRRVPSGAREPTSRWRQSSRRSSLCRSSPSAGSIGRSARRPSPKARSTSSA